MMGVYSGSPPFDWVNGTNLEKDDFLSQQMCEAMQALTNRANNAETSVADWTAYGYEGETLADLGQVPNDADLKTNKAFRHVNHIDDLRIALEAICPSYYVGLANLPDFWTIETLLQAAVSRGDYNRTTEELQNLGGFDGEDIEEILKCIDLLLYTNIANDEDEEWDGVGLSFTKVYNVSTADPVTSPVPTYDVCEDAYLWAEADAHANIINIGPTVTSGRLIFSTESWARGRTWFIYATSKWTGGYQSAYTRAVFTPNSQYDDGYYYYVKIKTTTWEPNCCTVPSSSDEEVEEQTAIPGASHECIPTDMLLASISPCGCERCSTDGFKDSYLKYSAKYRVTITGPYRRQFIYSP